MSQNSSLNKNEIEAAAHDLKAAEETGRQIGLMSRRFPDMDMDDSYAIQDELVRQKIAAGRKVIGWKIGLTSKAMQYALNIDIPDSGILFDDMQFEHGSIVPAGRFIQPRIEAEIAFVLKAPLAGVDVTREDVLAATDFVAPSIEILDTRIVRMDGETGKTRKIFDTISDNAANAGVVLGTERHESRTIDNQLRGRAGRQGDPGLSRFYLSLEDDLMRIFASDRVTNFMQALGMEDGEAIEHRMVTNAIEKAQRKVEGRNFDQRKQLLEYDDVANDQRGVIYEQRNELLDDPEIGAVVDNIRGDVINSVISQHIPPQSLIEMWDVPALEEQLKGEFNTDLPITQWIEEDKKLHEESLREKIVAEFEQAYKNKEEMAGAEVLRQFEKAVMLQSLDSHWKEHLAAMDHLRQGIGLRAHAQKNPKQEYKRESFELFTEMLDNLKYDVVGILSKVKIQAESDVEAVEEQHRKSETPKEFQHQSSGALDEKPAMPRVGRNEPCPCGSGKKYKQCHGKLT